MVLSGLEAIEIENLKHAHELQILDRKEEISKAEHGRNLERLAIENEIAKISGRSDERVVQALENIGESFARIEK